MTGSRFGGESAKFIKRNSDVQTLGAAVQPVIESLEHRHLMTTVFWAGGSGSWDTSATNLAWHVGSPIGPLTSWSNAAGYDAVFIDSGSNISVNATIDVNSIEFTGVGDHLTGRRAIVLTTAPVSADAINAAGTIDIAPGASVTMSNSVRGTVGMTLTGGGSLTLTAFANPAGATTVNSGTLCLNTVQPISSSGRSLTVNSGGTVVAGNAAALVNASGSGPAIVVNTGGTLTTGNGDNVGLAALSLNGGTLASGTVCSGGSSWDFISADVKVTAGSAVTAAGMAGKSTWYVSAGVDADISGSFGGTGDGPAAVTEFGRGTIELTGDDSSTVGPASFDIESGTLQIGDGIASGLVAAGSIFDAAAVVYDDPGTESLTGISGPGILQVAAGTLDLDSANSYTGRTVVAAGTLNVTNTAGSATGPGPVTVDANATLTGSGSIAGPVTVNAGGILSPGGDAAATLSAGPLTLSPGSTLRLSLAGDAVGGGYDRLSVNGPAVLTGSVLSVTGRPAGAYLRGMDVLQTTASIVGTFAGLPELGSITSGGVSFAGDYDGASGNDFVLTPRVPSTATLTSSSATVEVGQPVTFDVAVQAAEGVVPTGTVVLEDGGAELASGTLDASGKATFTVGGLKLGSHSITAVYDGAPFVTPAASPPISQSVVPDGQAVTTSLTATSVSSSEVDLHWSAGTATFAAYEVLRGVSGSQTSLVATFPGSVSSFDDIGLQEGVSYTYQIVAANDGSISNVATATTLLPAPAYAGPAAEPSYPAGFDTFNAPVGASASAGGGSPQYDEYTRSAVPNSTIAVTAESLTNATLGSGVADGTGTGFLAYGQTNSANGTLAAGAIQTLSGRTASVTLPASLPSDGLYFVWPSNTDSSGATQYGSPMVINQPVLSWVDTTEAVRGGTLSVFGKNLDHGLDAAHTADQSWLWLQPTDGSAGRWLTATASSTTDVNPYKADFTLPTANLYTGTYDVWVNNGLAGHYSWSGMEQITITSPPTNVTPAVVVAAGSTEAQLQSALWQAWTEANLYVSHVEYVDLPSGTITLTTPLQVPAQVQLVGTGQTVLQVSAGANLEDAVDLGQGGRNGLIDLAIDADGGGISLTSVGSDNRNPAVIQIESAGQVLTGITVSDVNPGGYSAEDVSSSAGVTGLRITGSTFTGAGLYFGNADDLVIDRCTFIGAGDTIGAVSVNLASDVSITHSVIENYDSNPADEYGSFARVFWLSSGGDNFYLGNNSSVGLFATASLASGLNGGEQILSEANGVAWEGAPAAAATTLSTLTLPASAGLPGAGWSVSVGAGPGLGQARIITAAATNPDGTVTLSLDAPWNVAPTAASTVILGPNPDGFAVYGNSLSGDGAASFEGSTSGVQLAGYNVSIDSNTITAVVSGIFLWSVSKNSTTPGTGPQADVNYFDSVVNNTVSNVQYGGRDQVGSYAAAEPVDLMLGNDWRGNTVSDIHAADGAGGGVPSAFLAADFVPNAAGQDTTNIFEANTTDSYAALQFTTGGNVSPVTGTVNTLVRDNSFWSDGSPASMGIYSTVTEAGFATVTGNSYFGFANNYWTPLATATGQLVVPQRAFAITLAPGETESAALLLQGAGMAAVSWSLAGMLPTWLSIGTTSGTIPGETAQASVPLTVSAAALPPGAYTAVLRVLLAGSEVVDVTVSVDVVA
jgi:autotransporter-associated beta strand protein